MVSKLVLGSRNWFYVYGRKHINSLNGIHSLWKSGTTKLSLVQMSLISIECREHSWPNIACLFSSLSLVVEFLDKQATNNSKSSLNVGHSWKGIQILSVFYILCKSLQRITFKILENFIFGSVSKTLVFHFRITFPPPQQHHWLLGEVRPWRWLNQAKQLWRIDHTCGPPSLPSIHHVCVCVCVPGPLTGCVITG